MAMRTKSGRGGGRRNPEALAQFKLARSLVASGQTEQAADCYRQAIELEPAFAEAVVNLGILYGQLGPRYGEQQLACLRRGVDLNPESARAHYNLGVALARRKGGADEAIAQFELALEQDPGHRNALYALSQQFSKRGAHGLAENFHRRYRAAMGQAEPALGPAVTAFVPAPAPVPTAPFAANEGAMAAEPWTAEAVETPVASSTELRAPHSAVVLPVARPESPASRRSLRPTPRLKIRFIR